MIIIAFESKQYVSAPPFDSDTAKAEQVSGFESSWAGFYGDKEMSETRQQESKGVLGANSGS